MSTVLIGFLGRGTYWQGERKPYWRTRYRFVDWTSQRVTFFLHATIDWLQYKHGKLPDRVVVLGTSGSMWDEMVSALCSPQDPRDRERIEGHCLELIARVDDQSVSQSDLETVQSILSDALQVSVHAELIPPAKEQHEQGQILAALQRHVQEEDRVYLDVTHGYRHQPMLGLGAALLLSQLRKARIEDILYGANDMKTPESEVAPVVSLQWLLGLLAWGDGIRQLRVGGRIRELPRVVDDEDLQRELAETAFLLSTNQVHRAGVKAMECRERLRSTSSDPILNLTRDSIESALTQVAGCQRDAAGILGVARSALQEQDFVRTSTLIVESIRKHRWKQEPDQETVGEIRALRNALTHAIPSGGHKTPASVQNAMQSRTQMVKTLSGQLTWVAEALDADRGS